MTLYFSPILVWALCLVFKSICSPVGILGLMLERLLDVWRRLGVRRNREFFCGFSGSKQLLLDHLFFPTHANLTCLFLIIKGQFQLRVISLCCLVKFLRIFSKNAAFPIKLKPCVFCSEHTRSELDFPQIIREDFKLLDQCLVGGIINLVDVEEERLRK